MSSSQDEKKSEGVIDPLALKEIRCLRGDDDPKLLKEFLEIFFRTSPGYLANIEAAIQGKNMPETVQEAHRFKNACAALGARRLFALCTSMEKIARVEPASPDSIKALLQDLEAMRMQYEIALRELKSIYKELFPA